MSPRISFSRLTVFGFGWGLALAGHDSLQAASDGTYAGAATGTLTVNSVREAMNGYQFRGIVTDCFGSVTSVAARLTALATAPH